MEDFQMSGAESHRIVSRDEEIQRNLPYVRQSVSCPLIIDTETSA